MFKKGDPTDIKNYRPLSMTNTIYKLLTTVINDRLAPACAKIIGPHQVGFMKGRNYFDNIKLVQTLLDQAEQLKTPLFAVLLDQEKAYDRVSHEYLWGILEQIPFLIQAIKNYYGQATSVVMVNKHLSEPFAIYSGVRQGDLLSCLLFNLAIKPLARLLLASNKVPEVTDLSGKSHKVQMYADDTTVFIIDPKQWRWAKKIYQIYARRSGAKLNEDKTVIMVADINNSSNSIGQIPVLHRVPADYLGVPVEVGIFFDEF